MQIVKKKNVGLPDKGKKKNDSVNYDTLLSQGGKDRASAAELPSPHSKGIGDRKKKGGGN